MGPRMWQSSISDRLVMEPKKLERVDLDKVLRANAGKMYRFIPGFLIRYLQRIVCQDQINEELAYLKDFRGLEFIEKALIERFEMDIELELSENLPAGGRHILVANHPLGGLDGMALMHVVGKKRPDLKFLSNDLLLELHNLRELFIPVNKHGRNTAEMVQILESYFASEGLILIFPAGLVSRRQGSEIRDLEWKKTFVAKAVQHKRDVIPVYIEGKNSGFFYNLALWRKRLGIKFNVEMLFLPDEMFKQQNKRLRIIIGEPIPHQTFTKAYSHREWAQKVKEHVYGLPEGKLSFNA